MKHEPAFARIFWWSVVATLMLPVLLSSATAEEAKEPVCNRTIVVKVVALDQPFLWNRLGAANPQGMVYALERDVVPTDYDPESGSEPGPLEQGKVRLRENKRARPIVLRANVGDCLRIQFRNLLQGSSPDRLAGVHVAGLELVPARGLDGQTRQEGISSDGSWVGGNANSPSYVHEEAQAKWVAEPGTAGSLAAPGKTKIYTLYAKEEGTFLLYSGGDALGTLAQNGLFGAVNVQPRGAEWYRSQVARPDLQAACLKGEEVAPGDIVIPGNPTVSMILTEEKGVYDFYMQTAYRRTGQASKVRIGPGNCIQGRSQGGDYHNLIDYHAVYPEGGKYSSGQPIPQGTPVLSMLQVIQGEAKNFPLDDLSTHTNAIRNLERGFIPEGLEARFKEAGFELSDAAVVTHGGGHSVVITDQGSTYQAKAVKQELEGKPYTLIISLASLELVHSDLTAIITGPNAGRFPYSHNSPSFRTNPATPDRRQPYREYTIIYHQANTPVQAFAQIFGNDNVKEAFAAGNDGFAINYGTAGIGAEILANRIGVGPMGNRDAVDLKYEEFFLASWAVGDPAMIVDIPANANAQLNPEDNRGKPKASKAFYPDDPSNVYHSYMRDHVKFRILHAGKGPSHVHHLHAHQWLHSPNSDNGHYLDSQLVIPGSAYTLEITYNGSGNRNQTVGDSIFHCHFYPHFAQGMWSLWRVHDVFEAGTELDENDVPVKEARALPDGEIRAGTPIPAVVPLPTLAMAPLPAKVRLTDIPGISNSQGRRAEVVAEKTNDQGLPVYKNPGFPFFIPGVAGHRAPHPPLDFAWKEQDGKPALKDGKKQYLDGGLPRHLILDGEIVREFHTRWDFTKDFLVELEDGTFKGSLTAFRLPEEGTPVEEAAMKAHATRTHASIQPNGDPGNFVLNGLPPVHGAPYAAPDVNDFGDAVVNPRRYKAAVIQMDVVLNKKGWHYPQQRFLTLWGDIGATTSGQRPPQPFFFRSNTGDSVEFWHTDLVPFYYELDDFQVRTPTDVIGQHIHLVKFDVTSSDGAANGFNYEDGTLSPDEVRDRIHAVNNKGGLYTFDEKTQFQGNTQEQLEIKAYKQEYPETFGEPPAGQNWDGAQTTIQRWDTDPLLNNEGKDRTLRTVFTHDHFSPSTHQQIGLYAGLVVEPENSEWFLPTGDPMYTRDDGGPTSWHGYIVTADPDESYREFVLEFQDMQLAYTKDSIPAVSRKLFDPKEPRGQDELKASALFNTYQLGKGAIKGANGKTNTERYIEALNNNTVPKDFFDFFAKVGITLTKDERKERVVRITPSREWIIKELADAKFNAEQEYYLKATNFPPLETEKDTAAYITQLDNRIISDGLRGLFLKLGAKLCDKALVEVQTESKEWIVKPPAEPPLECNPAEYRLKPTKFTEVPGVPGMKVPLAISVSSPAISVYTSTIHPGWADPKWALNPHTDEANSGLPTCGEQGANCRFGNGAPFPQLISFAAVNYGTYSLNYRNEPVQLRVGYPKTDIPKIAQLPPEQVDTAYVFSSKVKRRDEDLNTQPKGGAPIKGGAPVPCDSAHRDVFKYPCRPLAPGMQPRDPYTPLLRAYANDKVQVRTLVGAHLQAHSFQIQGVKWYFEPSYTNSGYRNAQAMGLSEHFEMLFTLPPDAVNHEGLEHPPFADYLYAPSSGITGLTNGLWGILRAFDSQIGTCEDGKCSEDYLQPLPNNPKTESKEQMNMEELYRRLYEKAAHKRTFNITATTALQALKEGKLIYNERLGASFARDDALLYVRSEDLEDDGKLKDNVEIEPLILRAAAGDWIKVTLKNDFDPNLKLFSPGEGCVRPGEEKSSPCPWALDFGSPFAKGTLDSLGEVKPTISSQLLKVTTRAGLHPQLVSYDVTQANGVNVGFNPDQTVPAGETKTFYWYAGNLSVKKGCDLSQAAEQCVEQTPVEFGATNLVPSDLMVQPQIGLVGALIIEPEGSTWKEDTNTQHSTDVMRDRELLFREFVMVMQNMVFGQNMGRGVGAVNYRTEPFGEPYAKGFANDNPATPTFQAPAGIPVRFRVLMPSTSAGNSASGPSVITVHGHVWQEEPYVDRSGKLGYNPLSQWFGMQQIVPYEAFDFVLPSAGGTCRVAGDYLYNAFQQSPMLGMWGLFRVSEGEGVNPACDPLASQ